LDSICVYFCHSEFYRSPTHAPVKSVPALSAAPVFKAFGRLAARFLGLEEQYPMPILPSTAGLPFLFQQDQGRGDVAGRFPESEG